MEQALPQGKVELRWKSLSWRFQSSNSISSYLWPCNSHLKLMSETLELILLKTTLFIMTFINIPLIVQHPKVPALQKNKGSRHLPRLFFLRGWGGKQVCLYSLGTPDRSCCLVKHTLSLCWSLRKRHLTCSLFHIALQESHARPGLKLIKWR